MTKFLLIIIILIAVIYFYRKNKSKNQIQPTSIAKPTNQTIKAVEKPTQKLNDGQLLYKTKGIKSFEIKGLFYQGLNPKIHGGEFKGYAKTDNNSHDMYAVEIYNEENKLLGYTPKRNKRLNNSINEWHNGKVIIFGGISHDDYDNKWYGNVYIPVGYTENQLVKVEQILKLKSENHHQINKKEKSTEKYFEILNRHREINNLLTELKNPIEFYYSFPKNLIPSISSHLEKEKNWTKLLELENYQDLISDLSEKFKETTLERIETAKKNVA